MLRPAARSFIRRTNSSSLPAICSAIATLASLPEAITIHLIIVSTVCSSPSSKNTFEPVICLARALVATSSASESSPLASASKIKIRVIIFVMLAGCSCSEAFFSYITCPVEASIKSAARAVIPSLASSPASPGTAAAGSARHNTSSKIRHRHTNALLPRRLLLHIVILRHIAILRHLGSSMLPTIIEGTTRFYAGRETELLQRYQHRCKCRKARDFGICSIFDLNSIVDNDNTFCSQAFLRNKGGSLLAR